MSRIPGRHRAGIVVLCVSAAAAAAAGIHAESAGSFLTGAVCLLCAAGAGIVAQLVALNWRLIAANEALAAANDALNDALADELASRPRQVSGGGS